MNGKGESDGTNESQYRALLSSMSGAEHYAVGLSPSYWAHVPLLVKQLADLVVVDGILCLDKPRDHDGQLIPVTKCVLVGIVVAVDARYESTAYVLDDGTGLVDCIHWTDHAAMLLTEAFSGATVSGDFCPTYSLGDRVRVYGRIVHCYSLQDDVDNRGERRSIREIHASLVEPVHFNAEIEHWKRCATLASTLSGAVDVLKNLGPRVGAQVLNLATVDDTDDIGAWKLFGIRCPCKLSYKTELLYCHCHASPETLDPIFTFRDFLLEKLLRLESKLPNEEELRFQYQRVKASTDVQDALTSTASVHVGNADNPTDLSVSKERLYRGTFQCLRDDGILFLVHPPSDTYILNSYSRVLSRDCRRRPLPDHLSKVPKVRLEVVRRMIAPINR